MVCRKLFKEFKSSIFLSFHTQHDYNRKLAKKSNLKKFFALKYTEKFIEPFVLKSAQKITIDELIEKLNKNLLPNYFNLVLKSLPG